MCFTRTPGSDPAAIEQFEEQPLSEESKRKILWDNAARAFGLETAPQ